MSRYFVLPEKEVGEGGDIYFRKHPAQKDWYRLFVGNKEFGFVVNNQILGWSAYSYNFNVRLRHLDGFKNRLPAAFYIIKHHGYWLGDERETAEMNKRLEARAKELRKKKTKKS